MKILASYLQLVFVFSRIQTLSVKANTLVEVVVLV